MEKSVIAYELHRQAHKNYPTRQVTLKSLTDLIQMDLVDMIAYSRQNKGYKYILTIINCLSKLAHAIPLKTKLAEEIVKGVQPILEKYPIKNVQTDKGKEFFNSKFAQLMRKYKINHYSTYSEKKASIVERFNRSLKQTMWTKFTEQGSYKWLGILDRLVQDYNSRVHRTIGMRPIDVKEKHEKILLSKLSDNYSKFRKQMQERTINRFYPGFGQRIELGDQVRVSKYKMIFDKGYLPNWSNELFTVTRERATVPVTYELEDYQSQPVQGAFYAEELLKTKQPEVFEIEKVIRKKGDRLLVRWKGYNHTHDSWINKSDLV